MRIIEASYALGLGGTEKAMCTYAKYLKRMGHDITLVGFNENGARGEEAARNGMNVRVLGGDPVAWRELLADADVLHWHGDGRLDERVFGPVADNRPKLVIETNVFGMGDNSSLYDLIDYDLYISEMCLVRRMRADGDRGQESKGKKRVLHYPVETDVILSALPTPDDVEKRKKALGLSGCHVVGRIGRADDLKFDLVTIHAMRYVLESFPKAKFLLVGPTDRIRKHIDKLGLMRSFVLLDPTSDLKDLLGLYGCMDVFLAVSAVGETFGMVLVESMLCQVPIVTASTPNADNAQIEIVRHGVDGFVVKKYPRLLAEATCNLLANPELRVQMGRDGQQGVCDRYDAPRIVGALDRIIRNDRIAHSSDALIAWTPAMGDSYYRRCRGAMGRPLMRDYAWRIMAGISGQMSMSRRT